MNQTQPRSDIAYSQSIDDLITQFQTDSNKGLKTSEIEEKYVKYGFNELPKIKKSLWKIYLAPIFNFLIIILIISAAIVIILGDLTSTIITFT
ncbi:MAG: cation-transporting P-type ATPase, partial [Promethearchaeota archaeon]